MFWRFTSEQTYRIFLFLDILFAIHHSLRCWCYYFAFQSEMWIAQNFNFNVLEDFCLSLSWRYRFSQNVNYAKNQSKTIKY